MDDICTIAEQEEDPVYEINSFIIIENDNVLCTLLREWNMESILPKLIGKNIDLDSLKYLTEIELNAIFKDDLGNQARFRARLLEWKAKNNIPNSLTLNDALETASNTSSSISVLDKFVAATQRSSTPISTSSSSQPPQESFVLENFFKTPSGIKIQSMYENQMPPQLSSGIRELLCMNIARYFVEHNKCMTINDFRNVTSQIIEHFPEENADYYFKLGKYPQGKLYNKYRVISRNLKKVGYFTDSKRQRKVTFEEDPSDVELKDQEEIFDPDKNWLKSHNTPWEVVELKWKSSHNIRIQDIEISKDTTLMINEWPLYKNTNGFRLIEIDFEQLYPQSSGKLFDTWNNFTNKIHQIFSKKIKDKAAINLYQNLSNNEDILHIQLCKLVHYILKPSGKQKKDDGLWKFSINDSIESFLKEIIEPSHVEDTIRGTKEFCVSHNIKLQPFIIFIKSSNKFCVVYDDVYYMFDKFLLALDICFKVFFVFKLKYPRQSEKFWLFIQKYIFNISTCYDNLTPDIIDLLSEMEKN